MQDKDKNNSFGIDINEFTTNVDFDILSKKIDFLYLRSSGSGTGKFRVDKKFLEFAKSAMDYNIPVGAYHYGVPSKDLSTVDSQCDDFIKLLEQGFGEKNYGDLFPVLDIETPKDKSITTKELVCWIDKFRKRFEKKTKRRLMLYTGLFFIQIYDNFFVEGEGYPLSNMPLWIAMYKSVEGNPPFPTDAGGWSRWRIWQYTETEKIEGVGNPVDGNYGPNNVDLLMQPKKVECLWARRHGNKINITWKKSDDKDVIGYNLFANNYWIGTVDENDTDFSISLNKLPFENKNSIKISIESFDFDGETSKSRTSIFV